MHMQFDGFDDEQWDEFRWEAHLNEVEKRSEQLRKFISSSHQGTTPRWITLLQESVNEDEAFEAFIEEELLMDEAYFPEDDDDWDDDDEDMDDDDFLFGYDDMDGKFDFDDYDDGEEWKRLTGDSEYDPEEEPDFGDLDKMDTYFDAKVLGVELLGWCHKKPLKSQSKDFQEFVSATLKIGAKLAGGHSFGFELEYIGANIAYAKKALAHANRALELMQKLKKKSIFLKEDYLKFHSELFELRNSIGIYIQELRDQFRLGLD